MKLPKLKFSRNLNEYFSKLSIKLPHLPARLTKKLGTRRQRFKALALLLAFLVPLVVYTIINTREAAAWWDDSYAFRQEVSFTHNAAINEARAVTLTVDTAEFITDGIIQSDCDDIRFTDRNGLELKYDFNGPCNNADSEFEVIFPNILNGTNTFYIYYGNESAVSKSIDSAGYTALTPSGGDPSVDNRTAEENAPTPLLYWKFDEGTGTSAADNTPHNHDGTVASASTLLTEAEQQINIINGEFTTTNTSDSPTDNSLGLILWDGSKYNGETVYFEALIKCTSCSGGNTAALATLYTDAGGAVTGATASTTNTSYTLVRSSAITANLTEDEEYTVRLKVDATSGTAAIKAARLIIVQSSTSITDTVNQIELGDDQEITGTSYAELTDPKYFYYDTDKYSGTETAYLEATLKGDGGGATQGDGRIWSSGFELNSAAAGVEWEFQRNTATVQGTTKRSGNYAMQITSLNSTQDRGLGLGFDVGTGPYYYRVYFKVDTLPSAENQIIRVRTSGNNIGGTTLVAISIDNSGQLRLYDEDGQIGSASSALSTGTWYRIELETDRSASAGSHVIRARIDGTEFAGSSTRDISVNFTGLFLGGNLNAEGNTTGNWYFDDIAINNSTGGYPGPGNIFHLKPNATGDQDDWSSDYTAIDEETPNDGTDVISSNTSGQIIDVNLDDTPSELESGDIINVVSVGQRQRVTDPTSGDPRYRLRVKASASGTTQENTSDLIPNSASWMSFNTGFPWVHKLTLYDLPGASTTDWTKSDLDSAQIGVRLTVSDTDSVEISTLWMLVDYTPAEDLGVSAQVKLEQCDEGSCSWSEVSGSTISQQANSFVRVRSNAITLTNDRRYRIAVSKSSASGTIEIANAKLIIEQTDAAGLTAMELVHQLVNTGATDNDSTYTSQEYLATYNPDNYTPNPTAYFESTLKTSAGTGYAQAYNNSAASAISGTEVTTTSTTYTRVRSSSFTPPASTSTIDTQLKNSASNTTTAASTTLVLQLTGSTTGTLPTWQNEELCIRGSCLYFEGDVVKRVYESDSLLDPGTGSFSISAWFRHTASLSGTDTLMGRFFAGGYKVYTSMSGMCFGIDNDGSSFPSDSACSTNTYADYEWHQVTAVKNGTSEIKLYIDGIEVGSDASITSSSVSGSTPTFTVGAEDASGTNPWSGFVDDVKYFDYALSAAQIKANYAASGASNFISTSFGEPYYELSDGLVGYWQMNDALDAQTTLTFPASGTNDAGYGTLAWSNPGDIISSNDTRASVTLSGNTNNSNYLYASNFGFSVPTGSTIVGIQARDERRYSGGTTGAPRDNVVRLVKNGTVVGDNLARTSENWTSSDVLRPYGQTSGLWGTSWTPADINDTDFGIVHAVTGDSGTTDRIAEIDAWRINVYYTENYNATDVSGNGNTLTNNANTYYAGGKFGLAPDFVPASSQYFSSASTINNVYSVSFWTYPDSTTNYYLSLASNTYLTSTSGTLSANGFTNPKYFVNGVETTTIASGAWQHVIVTSTSPITADQVYVGRQGSNYMDGRIDEIRFYNKILSMDNIKQLYEWTPRPILYYPFDDNSGTSTVADKSGNNLNSTMNGSMTQEDWVPGKFGSALDLDGSNDYLSLADTPQLNFGRYKPLTISFWVNVGTGSGTDSIIFKGQEENSGEYDGSYQILYDYSDNRLEAYVSGDTWNEYCSLNGATDIEGAWHHISFVVHRNASCTSSDTLLYVDGVLENSSLSSTGDTDANMSNNDPLTIGAYYSDGSRSQYINATLDDFKIYDYARSPQQVVQDMNAGHPVPGSPIGSAVGHWKMDEGYGSTVNDSGTGNNSGSISTLSSPATSTSGWTNSGKLNKGLKFDGGDDVMVIGDDNSLDITGEITLSAWFYPTDLSTENYIFSKSNCDPNCATNYGLSVTSNNEFRFWFANPANTYHTYSTSGANVQEDTWNHIVSTYDDTNNEIKFYLNGTEYSGTVIEGSPLTTSIVANDDALTIGGFNNGDGQLAGTLDELRIYNSALDQSQVNVLYSYGFSQVAGSTGTDSTNNPTFSANNEYCPPGQGTTCTPPVGEWKLDENTGTVAYDTSENENNGAFSGTLAWAPGVFGSGILTQATSSGLDITDPTGGELDFGTTQSFTLSAWAKSTTASSARIITKGGFSVGNPAYRLRVASDGRPSCDIHDGTNSDTNVGPDSMVDGEWHHVVCVRNASGTKWVSVYLDGVKVVDESTDTIGSLENTQNLNISHTGSSGWPGNIDNVRIYNYAMTDAQVAWDYNRGKPIGWWKLDDNVTGDGQTVYDSAKDNNGTTEIGGNATGMDCTISGKRGLGCDLDGTDDYIQIAYDAILDVNGWNEGSSAVWFKPDTTPGSATNIFRDIFNNDYSGFEFRMMTDNTLDCSWRNGSSSNNRFQVTAGSLTNGAWHHAVMTYNNGVFNCYINGKLIGTDTSGATAGTSNVNNNIRIGSDPGDSGFFDGKVDDARLYYYALTEEQVKVLYNQGAVSFE